MVSIILRALREIQAAAHARVRVAESDAAALIEADTMRALLPAAALYHDVAKMRDSPDAAHQPQVAITMHGAESGGATTVPAHER